MNMLEIVTFAKTKFLFVFVILVLFLCSCSDENRIHSNYIPTNSCIVVSVNTEKIFNDAVFDLMANKDLDNNLRFIPFYSMVQNPSAAGLKMFSKSHVFVSGSNLFDVKVGAILPLNDGEDLAEYVQVNFRAKVIENDGFRAAKISEKHNLIWDDYTAIYFSGESDGDIIKEGKNFFIQADKEILATKDSTLSYALNADVHISTWLKNDDFAKFINQGLILMDDLSAFDVIFNSSATFNDGKTVLLTSFNDGNITTRYRQYLTPEQTLKQFDTEKENNISALVPMAISENPLVLVSTSLNPTTLIELLKMYGLGKDWNQQVANFSFLPQINQLSDYLEGDVLVLVDGFEEVAKVKEVPDIDDEGNDTLVSKAVIDKNPVVSFGLTVKDSIRFNFMINLLGSNLPKEDGFFNFNDEVYFAVRGNYFFLTSTKQGVEAVNEMSGELSPHLNSMVLKHTSVCYFDVGEILKQDERLAQFNLAGANNLNNVLLFKDGVTSNGIIEGETRINFTNQQNSVVSTLKLFSDLFGHFNPSDSMSLIKF